MDKVFLVFFARYRRKMGESSMDAAWNRATYKVSAYVSWPIAAATLLLVVLAYVFFKTGSHIEHKRIGQIAAVIAWIATAFMLNRRFSKYLASPPTLAVEESPTETRLLLWFRMASFGIFALTCLVGLSLHFLGINFLQGF